MLNDVSAGHYVFSCGQTEESEARDEVRQERDCADCMSKDSVEETTWVPTAVIRPHISRVFHALCASSSQKVNPIQDGHNEHYCGGQGLVPERRKNCRQPTPYDEHPEKEAAEYEE